MSKQKIKCLISFFRLKNCYFIYNSIKRFNNYIKNIFDYIFPTVTPLGAWDYCQEGGALKRLTNRNKSASDVYDLGYTRRLFVSRKKSVSQHPSSTPVLCSISHWFIYLLIFYSHTNNFHHSWSWYFVQQQHRVHIQLRVAKCLITRSYTRSDSAFVEFEYQIHFKQTNFSSQWSSPTLWVCVCFIYCKAFLQ